MASLLSEALFVLRQFHVLSLLELLSHLLDLGGIDGSLLGSEDGRLNESELRFTKKVRSFLNGHTNLNWLQNTYLVSFLRSQTNGFSNW